MMVFLGRKKYGAKTEQLKENNNHTSKQPEEE